MVSSEIMADKELEIPYHVMAISELAKDYSAAAFQVEIGQCREVIPNSPPKTTVLTSSAHATAYCAISTCSWRGPLAGSTRKLT
jgi:hypothetical protein